MRKLLLDIGNTAAKAAIADGTRLLCTVRCAAFTGREWQLLRERYAPEVAVIASVRGEALAEAALLQADLKRVLLFDHRTPVPVRNLYTTPHTLGVDRLAGAVGAFHLFPGRDCLIIDCGTAITFDFLSASGEFPGGNISPGLHTRFRALHEFTGRLPLCSLPDTVVPVGAATREAVEAGVVQGVVKEIEGYLAEYPTFVPILTGGDAFYLAERIKNPIFAVCNLNFLGLAIIADYNVY